MCSVCSNYTAAATKTTTTTKTTSAFPLPANVSAGDGIDFIEWLNLRKRDFRFFFDSFWQLRGLEYLQTTGAEGLFEFIPLEYKVFRSYMVGVLLPINTLNSPLPSRSKAERRQHGTSVLPIKIQRGRSTSMPLFVGS